MFSSMVLVWILHLDLTIHFLFRIKIKACSNNKDDIPFLRNIDHDLISAGQTSLTDDPEEAKLDYWREDSLFHAFHVTFHKIWDRYALDESSNRFERTFELFFYAHQQMQRR